MTRDEHLMVIAMEECNEVAQRISKALRFGKDERQTDSGADVFGAPEESLSNIERVRKEYSDLVAVMTMLDIIPDETAAKLKIEKVERFLLYSGSRGTLIGG